MARLKPDHLFLLLLITAFLAMQWTTNHIHLAAQHDHDGSHHQHNIEAHSHYSNDHHADAIDTAHQIGDSNVVELDHECTTYNCDKQLKHSAAAITLAYRHFPHAQLISTGLPAVINTKISRLLQSTIKPRAPPRLS